MPEPKRYLKVFLSYSSQDRAVVRELSRRLANEGWIDPWLDEKKLLPGQDWRTKIEEAVETSDIVIICLSSNSVTKEGFVQKELRYAREIAFEKPEETIFLIPLRLDDCTVPRGLRFYQWGDYFGEEKKETYNNLLESLKLRHEQMLKFEAEELSRKEKAEKESIALAEKARRAAEERARLEAEALARQKTAREIVIKPEGQDADKPLEIKQLLPKAEKSKPDKSVVSRNPNIAITVALIGLVGTICAVLINSPLITNLFIRTPEPTATSSTPLAELIPIPHVGIISIVAAGLLDAETVTIKNTGDTPLNLTGLQLMDSNKNIYTFPNLILNINGAVQVHTKSGTDTVIDLYWNASAPIWESGEEAKLLDSHGSVVDTYQVP